MQSLPLKLGEINERCELENVIEGGRLDQEDSADVIERAVKRARGISKAVAKANAGMLAWLEEEAMLCTIARIVPASTAKRGTKKLWHDDMLAFVWVQIEQRRLAAGAKHVEPFIDGLFAGLRRKKKSLIVHIDAATGERITVNNPKTARRLYAEALKKISDNPHGYFALACRRLLEIQRKQ